MANEWTLTLIAIDTASSSTSYLTVQNSNNLKKSGNWATHNLYALRQKDTELRSASPYNNMDTGNPVVDFDKFFDGESLDQEDLVLYDRPLAQNYFKVSS